MDDKLNETLQGEPNSDLIDRSIVEILIRLATMENLLIQKGVLTEEEVAAGINKYSEALVAYMEKIS